MDSKINWGSWQQVQALLWALGASVKDTEEGTLWPYRDQYPIVRKLLARRKVSKRVTTYGQNWRKHVNKTTERIHSTWHQNGTETGRMSSATPNLQNLPRDDRYRRCFIPTDGNVFIKADYPQIELRIAAELSGDPDMIAAFQRGDDIHKWVVSQITGKPIDTITGDERQRGKAANFGLLFGQQAEGLRDQAEQDYGVILSLEEAVELRRQWLAAFPRLAQWQEEQRGRIETRTILGRRRTWKWPPPITELLNSPIQGSAADGMKLAMALLWETWTPELEGCFAVAVIHDELVIEAPMEKRAIAKVWVKEAMESGMRHLLQVVPIEVNPVACINLVDQLPGEEKVD
jgi:DNA polymerase I